MKKLDLDGVSHIIEAEDYNKWLESAKELDIYHCTKLPEFRALTDVVFKEIIEQETINNKDRSKQTLKMFLLNLWIAALSDNPVRLSLNRNNYKRAERYGKLYFKYKRVKKIVNALYDLNYTCQKAGYYNRQDEVKRQTRIHAAEKLTNLFNKYLNVGFDVVYRLPPRELLQLKDKDKAPVNYNDNKWTIDKRLRLNRYNNFIQGQDIKIDVSCFNLVKADFVKDFKYNLLKGLVGIEYLEMDLEESDLNILKEDKYYNSSIIYKDNKLYLYNIHNNYYNNIKLINNNIITIYDIISIITKNLLIKKHSYKDKEDNKEKIILSSLGITKLVLNIKYSRLHRVFNKGSFGLGGRYYGAFHIGMPKELRGNLLINEDKVVELDYSAQHIRMLYHLEKKDYKKDPYRALCEKPEDRKMYKLVQLVSINAKNVESAIKGLRFKFYKEGIKHPLTNESLLHLIEKFKKVHEPIEKYLTSSVGGILQNIDSEITDYILMNLMEEGIPALPVHDSYIVDANYENNLAGQMADEYEKILGFEPVIEKK